MKYIRTNDGIYEIDVLSIHYIGETHFSCWDVKRTRTFNDWHIIKQSDTIEELCDEKVGTFEDKSKPYIYKQTSWTDLKKDWKKYHNNLYGAIWTDKGLIYVAKMNDEGVLCLI